MVNETMPDHAQQPPETSAALARARNLGDWYGRMESRASVKETMPPATRQA
jgi:hypothetical protein